MRLRSISNNIALSLVTTGSIVTATPAPFHKHNHAHVEKRDVKIVDVPGPVVVAYELNGQLIDQSEVCEGVQNGTLKWADGTNTPPECSSSVAPISQPASSTPASATILDTMPVTSPSVIVQQKQAVTSNPVHSSQASSPLASLVSTSVEAPNPISSAAAPSPSETSSSISSSTSGGQGLDADFPDGTIDCTNFPSNYGPIEVAWAELGGWSGIQYVTIEGNTVTNIDTATPGEGCKPGAMCSYACPAGYQKSQWPTAQGSTGQSVGGLQCNSNGKLTLTNPGLSKTLCIKGTGATSVQNKLSNNAAICRTDYPGTENEIVPLNTEPDSTNPLTCPDASTYYSHDGDPTSAQYYINNQGVAVQSACTWGTDGSDMGNWAPSYLGVGQDISGKTWLSISSTAQNEPSSYTPLNYTVSIEGDTSGNCKLCSGKYCSGDNYDDCNDQGCTVELMSGQATYVLTDGSSC